MVAADLCRVMGYYLLGKRAARIVTSLGRKLLWSLYALAFKLMTIACAGNLPFGTNVYAI